jgi:hypothetical protein
MGPGAGLPAGPAAAPVCRIGGPEEIVMNLDTFIVAVLRRIDEAVPRVPHMVYAPGC